MVYKFTVLNWLKAKIDGNSGEDESDNMSIECGLIRAISEYREKELRSLCVDKDFDTRLLNRLNHIELEVVEVYSTPPNQKSKFPIVFSAGFATIAVIITFSFYLSENPSIWESTKSPAYSTTFGTKSSSSSQFDLEEEALMKDLKSNPQNIKLLERLENYYSDHGKKEQATEIHYMLETVSKRY